MANPDADAPSPDVETVLADPAHDPEVQNRAVAASGLLAVNGAETPTGGTSAPSVGQTPCGSCFGEPSGGDWRRRPRQVGDKQPRPLATAQWGKVYGPRCPLCGGATAQPSTPAPSGYRPCAGCDSVGASCRAAGCPATTSDVEEPSGVTITEWLVDCPTHATHKPTDEKVARHSLAVTCRGGRLLHRQRTTFPDRVTDWQEATP
jgi:hypothetical protein